MHTSRWTPHPQGIRTEKANNEKEHSAEKRIPLQSRRHQGLGPKTCPTSPAIRGHVGIWVPGHEKGKWKETWGGRAPYSMAVERHTQRISTRLDEQIPG